MTAYQGDIKKIITPDGSTYQLNDSDFLRDRGIENAVQYSLHVVDHFANIFANNSNQVLKSDYETLHDNPITVDNLLDIEDSARRSLQWMIDDGSVSKVDAKTTVDENGARSTVIWVYPVGSDNVLAFRSSKYAQNWDFQALDPASAKVNITW